MAPLERTAACFGVSTRSVQRVRERLNNLEEYPDADERERGIDVPDEFIPIVRGIVVAMYTAKEHVTLDSVLAKLHGKTDNNSLCNMEVESLDSPPFFLTSKISYSYGKRRTHDDNLKEDVSIAAQRVRYIKRIREIRVQG